MQIIPERIKSKIEELFGIDLRSLALFRICIALLIIVDLLQRMSDLSIFYTDIGIVPIYLVEKIYHHGYKYFSLHMLNGSIEFQLALFIIALFSAGALLLGAFTRFFTLLLWFLTLSLHIRTPWHQIGGDELIRMLLFWSIFLPLNAYYAIDTHFFNSSRRTKILSVASLAILLQVVLIYWISVIYKIKSVDWINGDAIYYILNNENQVTKLGQELFHHYNLLKFLTYGTLLFEIIGPLLLFFPFYTFVIRTLMIVSFVFFQFCIGSCLELTIFPWASSIAMILFLPGKVWDIIIKRSNLTRINYYKRNDYANTLYSSKLANLIACSFLLLLILWNISIIKPEVKPGNRIISLVKILKFDTKWVMYANPHHFSFWYHIPGRLKDGSLINLKDFNNKLILEKPDVPSSEYKNRNWRRFIESLVREQNTDLFKRYSIYLCTKWNSIHPKNKQLEYLSIILYFKKQLPNYHTEGPFPREVWVYKCEAEQN